MNRLSSGHPSVRSIQCYIVFDGTDGTIYQIHEAITLEGARLQTDAEVEKRALALVAERGIDTSRLRTIAVAPEAIKSGRRYVVDPATSTLVEHPRDALR